jgi:hypothetical protein
MAIKVRALLGFFLVLFTMSLPGCGHYTCGVTFGGTCTSSGGGLGTTGGGSGTAAVFAFAVNKAGTLDGYTLTSGSSPTFGPTSGYSAPTIPTNTEGSGMVVAQSKYLYTAFPGTGQIYGWTISTGGGLSAISGSPFLAPFLVGEPQGGLWSMITNPAGTLIFMVDTSGMSVHVFQVGSSGSLAEISGSPFAVPFFPGNLGTDGLGKYLYVTQNTNPAEMAAFAIGSSGSLTAVAGSPFSYPMQQVQGDASGKYLVGVQSSNYGFSNIYVFNIAQSGSNAGAISAVSGSPFAAVSVPTSFAIQPNSSGTLIYAFGINAAHTAYNPIEGFQLDTTTGSLSALSGSPFGGVSAGFWGQFDQSGNNLFVFGDVVNGSTVTAYLGALSVGSGGILTQPTPQTNLGSLGFWAITDPQ